MAKSQRFKANRFPCWMLMLVAATLFSWILTIGKFVIIHKSNLLHSLRCVVPCVGGLHYFIAISTLTLGVECPTLGSPILCQQWLQTFNFQIISYAFQLCLPGTARIVTTSYNCLVQLSWPCVWVHTLKMTVATKTFTSQYIFCARQTQSTS